MDLKWKLGAPKAAYDFLHHTFYVAIHDRDWKYAKCRLKQWRNYRYEFAISCLSRKQIEAVAKMRRDGTLPKFKPNPDLGLEIQK